MKSIINIVDRRRFGLLEHALALSHYARKHGYESKVMSTILEEDVEPLSFMKIILGKRKTIVIWSLGHSTLLIPVFRLFRHKVVSVVHEPGGLIQRLRKKDGIFYSLYVSLAENFQIFSSLKLTPNIKNAEKFKIKFAPLLLRDKDAFSKNTIKEKLKNEYSVYYLGRFDSRRGAEVFERLSLTSSELNFVKFPSKDLWTERQKIFFISSPGCILNIYSTPHNQSGVTVDALRLNLPVIVTDLDFISDDIEKYSLGIVINHKNLSDKNVLNAINELSSKDYSMNIKNYFLSNFGETAFKKHWLDIL